MTALRLPDQFSPGALGAAAATPTCCCCCCCCLASTLTTPIVLHGGLGRDLARVAEPQRPQRHEAARALSIVVWLASIFATALIVTNVKMPGDAVPLVITVIVLAAAAAVALIATWAGSPSPVRQAVRMVVGAAAFAVEFFAGAYLVLLGGYLFVGPVVALISVVVAMKVYRP